MSTGDDHVEVRIEQLPLDLAARAREHVDDVRRELALIARASTPGEHLPQRLVTLFDELEREYEAVSEAQEHQLEAATSSGADAADMVLLVPRDAATACTQLEEILDEADRYCASGEYLLSLVSPPEVVAFRRWFLGEFVRQIAGGAPEPWPRWAAEHA